MDRRTFLQELLGLGITPLYPYLSYLNPSLKNHMPSERFLSLKALNSPSNLMTEKSLSFYHCHTGEQLKKCVFWSEGAYNPCGLQEINRLFRDYRTQEIFPIDGSLLHLLHHLTDKMGSCEPVHLISGYRSAKTNIALRQLSKGVAENSQHLKGKAADIWIPNRSILHVYKAAQGLRGGGVGLYKNFVHIDTGPIRYWGNRRKY